MSSQLEKAISIAVNAHFGQVDKGGNPYLLHPLRVMRKLYTEDEKIVGVLHDVIEDTDITIDDLKREGFSKEITDAIFALTRQEGESYMGFIHRLKTNELARTIKIVDIEDNIVLSRIPEPTDTDYKRIEKYKKALGELKK
ncbi:GTP pyrophosphokinase [Paenibacillus medicaginis]|uniref:GTP pyrophosphokinase n=1 Tax=Paenibacillus medicaginis TaxID=1470560 RepID=A0ABV5BUP4_9BACL